MWSADEKPAFNGRGNVGKDFTGLRRVEGYIFIRGYLLSFLISRAYLWGGS